MHGADRIGGLSTANGLVFGTIAGESAAVYAHSARTGPDAVEYETFAAGDLAEQLKILQQTMFENAMVLRRESGLQEALNTVRQLRGSVTAAMEPTEDPLQAARTQRFLARCCTAESILRAALLRKESRGSHFRTDYPYRDPGQENRILIRMDEQGIHADYEKEV
jgi:L-aspartate oxidase